MHVFVVKKGKLIGYLMIFCGAIVAVIAIFFIGSGIIETATGPKYYPIRSVETTQKEVAITFDTAYGDADISLLYGYLNRYNVKATFFVTTDFLKQYRWEVETMGNSGHDVMNLSNRYVKLDGMSMTDIASEISSSDEIIRNIVLIKPTMFRPPMGAYSNNMIQVAKSLGYNVVLYSVDSGSFNETLPDRLANDIIGNITNGGIIRLRLGISADTQALPLVLEYLTNNGYQVLPLSKLLLTNDYEVDQNGVQHRTRITT